MQSKHIMLEQLILFVKAIHTCVWSWPVTEAKCTTYLHNHGNYPV